MTNQRPLLESGTMGAKGHVQVIIPHLTESYSSQVGKNLKFTCIIYSDTHTHTHIHTCIHIHTHAHTDALTYTHTYLHTHVYTHTHTHTYTGHRRKAMF